MFYKSLLFIVTNLTLKKIKRTRKGRFKNDITTHSSQAMCDFNLSSKVLIIIPG